MAVAQLGSPLFMAFDNNGNPLSGGKLFTYAAGTSTPLATYTDSTGGTPNANPVVLGSRGEPSSGIWLTIGSAYKLVLKDNSEAVTYWTVDNVQIVPNGNLSLIDDISANTTAFRVTRSPGGVGTENLPLSGAEEFQTLRYMHLARGTPGGTQWYEITKPYEIQGDVSTNGEDANVGWPDAASSTFSFKLRVPYNYASGSITLHLFRRILAGSGTAVMPYTITRVRNGAALVTISSGNINYAPGNTNSNDTTLTVSSGDITLGDILRFNVSRLGADGADDNAGTIAYDGHYFTYTGYKM